MIQCLKLCATVVIQSLRQGYCGYHETAGLGKERVCLFGLIAQELKQGRNLEAGADAEAIEECCLLAYSLWLAQPASYRTQDLQPRDDPTHNRLGNPTPITK